jgi:hypothetical protein
MEPLSGRHRIGKADHLAGAGLAIALASLGGAGLWRIASAGVPGGVPAQYGTVAALVPFVAGPAALCAGWSVLALWRAGRRSLATTVGLVAGAALLLGLFTAGAAQVRAVILFSIVLPLLVAHAAGVVMLGWITPLRRRFQVLLLAIGAVPLAAVFRPWPAPLWSLATLVPALVATPLLAAAFLTGTRPGGRPRSAPVLALAFFALPLALVAGIGLAAGVNVLATLAAALQPLLILLLFGPGAPVVLACLVLLVAAVALLAAQGEAAPATASAAVPPSQDGAVWPPGSSGAGTTAGVVEPARARAQALRLLTDRFLAGELSLMEYEAQLDYLLRPARERSGVGSRWPGVDSR